MKSRSVSTILFDAYELGEAAWGMFSILVATIGMVTSVNVTSGLVETAGSCIWL